MINVILVNYPKCKDNFSNDLIYPNAIDTFSAPIFVI
jgi:hypothetical protein